MLGPWLGDVSFFLPASFAKPPADVPSGPSSLRLINFDSMAMPEEERLPSWTPVPPMPDEEELLEDESEPPRVSARAMGASGESTNNTASAATNPIWRIRN